MKGQVWSYDIIAAVTVFVVAFMVFYSILTSSPDTEIGNILQEEGSQISSVARATQGSGNFTFVRGGAIRHRDLRRFSESDYTNLKREIGVSSEFCIHFEDEDGNLVNISGVTSVGSPKINLTLEGGGNYRCGES